MLVRAKEHLDPAGFARHRLLNGSGIVNELVLAGFAAVAEAGHRQALAC